MKNARPAVSLLSLGILLSAGAAEPTLQELDQKVRILERKIELAQEAAGVPAPSSVSAGPDGFAFLSADRSFQLNVKGYLQVDSRFYTEDPEEKSVDTFLVRRARLIFDGRLGTLFELRIAPDFGNGKSELQDGYIDFKPDPAVNVRMGLTKVPFGLERLQSSAETFLNEASLATALTPNTDVGIQFYGVTGQNRLEYAVGVFNGGADGAYVDTDSNDEKDLAGRLFFSPFKKDGPDLLRGLSVGVAGTVGDHQGTDASSGLPTYKTAGQQTFFTYANPTNKSERAFADGEQFRMGPQIYYTVQSFGLLGEYVLSRQEVANATTSDSLANRGWQVTASQVLTGEAPSLRGVKPLRPFKPAQGDWGAVECVLRYSALQIDADAFDSGYADRSRSASEAAAIGAGINWYLTRNAKVAVHYENTTFTDGATDGDRADEQIVIARVQLKF